MTNLNSNFFQEAWNKNLRNAIHVLAAAFASNLHIPDDSEILSRSTFVLSDGNLQMRKLGFDFQSRYYTLTTLATASVLVM